MILYICDRQYELDNLDISIHIKPYIKRMVCDLSEKDIDIEELSLYLKDNYNDTFKIDDTIYTNFKEVNVTQEIQERVVFARINFTSQQNDDVTP